MNASLTLTQLAITQLVPALAYIGTVFVLYRLLVDQKEAAIQALKERIGLLQDQLTEAKQQTVDVLVERLKKRVDAVVAELERLEKDKGASEEKVKEREQELVAVQALVDSLDKELVEARMAANEREQIAQELHQAIENLPWLGSVGKPAVQMMPRDPAKDLHGSLQRVFARHRDKHSSLNRDS